MKINIQHILIAIVLFIAVATPASAILPLEEYKNDCLLTGGFWFNDNCLCPPFTKSLEYCCWKKTEEQSCRDMGGKPEVFEAVPFSSIICKKNGEWIKTYPEKAIFETRFNWMILLVIILLLLMSVLRVLAKNQRHKIKWTTNKPR